MFSSILYSIGHIWRSETRASNVLGTKHFAIWIRIWTLRIHISKTAIGSHSSDTFDRTKRLHLLPLICLGELRDGDHIKYEKILHRNILTGILLERYHFAWPSFIPAGKSLYTEITQYFQVNIKYIYLMYVRSILQFHSRKTYLQLGCTQGHSINNLHLQAVHTILWTLFLYYLCSGTHRKDRYKIIHWR